MSNVYNVINGNGIPADVLKKNGLDCMFNNFEILQEVANYLLERTTVRPHVGIICGSGLGPLAETLTDSDSFPYEDVPHFPISTVHGHAGKLVFGYLNGIAVMCMQGRFHYYEGYPLTKCSMPIRVMKLLGITHLIATNAAGGLNPTYKVGDIMIVKDHINIMGFAGNNPLQGPNDSRFGPRFPPMSKAYSVEMRKLARKAAEELGFGDNVHEGVFTCLGGPNYETVAELKMLKIFGVDAVGMSTVHEVITARHCDMVAMAFSLITNKCLMEYDINNDEPNHEDVVAVARVQQTILGQFLSKIVTKIADENKWTKRK